MMSWQHAAGAVFYTYSYSNDQLVATNATTVLITGLMVDMTYMFNVTVHGRNVTGNSVTCQATTSMLLLADCLSIAVM